MAPLSHGWTAAPGLQCLHSCARSRLSLFRPAPGGMCALEMTWAAWQPRRDTDTCFWWSKGWPSSHLSCGETWPDVVLVECKAKNCSNEWTSTLLVSLGWKYIASSFTEHYHVLNLYRKMQFCKLYNCCAMAFSSFPLSHKPVFVSSPPSHQCY